MEPQRALLQLAKVFRLQLELLPPLSPPTAVLDHPLPLLTELGEDLFVMPGQDTAAGGARRVRPRGFDLP